MKNEFANKSGNCIRQRKSALWSLCYMITLFLLPVMLILCVFNMEFNNLSQTDLKLLVLLIIVTGIVVILYCLSNDIKKHFTLFIFTLVYLVFNIGAYLANFNNNPFGYIAFAGSVYYSYQDEAIGFIVMFIGLLSYFISYKLSSQNKRIRIKLFSNKNKTMKNDDNYNVSTIRYWAKVAMYIGAIAAFTKVGLMILQAQRFGYISIYVNTNYNIPILNVFDSFFELGLFAYLVTMPPFKKSILPLSLYFIYSCATLLYGRRNAFVTGILVILWYLLKMDITKVWSKQIMTKRKMVALVLCSCFGLAFLYYFSVIRLYFGGGSTSTDISGMSFGQAIRSLFEQFGFSGKLLPLTISMKEELIPLGRSKAIFYPITNYLAENVISRLLGFGSLATQSAMGITTRYSLGSWLTYYFWPSAYLAGGGTGTNYLAESYIWMGFIGVIVMNLIYGYLFYKIDNFEFNTWKSNLFCMYSYSVFITLPRSSALDIIPKSITLVLFMWILSFLSKRRKRNESVHDISDHHIFER